MENNPRPYYCIRCKQYKTAEEIKRCIAKNHSYTMFSSHIEYDSILIEEEGGRHEPNEKVAKSIWQSRFVDAPKEPIDRYSYDSAEKIVLSNNDEAICPVHMQHAVGYCFDCNRMICLHENKHFSHRHILFSDFGFKNEPSAKRRPLDEDGAIIEQHLKLLDEMRKVQSEKDEILKVTADIKKQSINMLLALALQASSDIVRKYCIKAAHKLEKLTNEKYEKDFKDNNIDILRSLFKLRTHTVPLRLRYFLRRLNEEVKPDYRIRGAFNLAFIMFGVPVYVDGAGLYCTEMTMNNADHDVIGFRFHNNKYVYAVAMRQSTRDISMSYLIIETGEKKQIEIKSKYKDFNHISRYANTKLSFVSDDDKLIEIDLMTMEVREVCPCVCKRLITVFEDKVSFGLDCSFVEHEHIAPISFIDVLTNKISIPKPVHTYMIQKEDGSLWYMRDEATGWIRIDYEPLDNEIEVFVRSPFTANVYMGTFISKNYIHKCGVPSVHINKCNSVYFENKILIIHDRSVKPFNNLLYFL